MTRKTCTQIEVQGKRAFVRADFNVPLSEDGRIADDFRIQSTLPTIRSLRERGGKVILASHLGRPGFEDTSRFSLRPVAVRLQELLNTPVRLLPDCVGQEVERGIREMQAGDVVLLENLRFHGEEEKNDEMFAKSLAKLGDVYINDAFGACHRAHASIVGVPTYLPSAAGLLIEKEISALSLVSENPERPFVTIVGGAKIATKSDFVDEMSLKADAVLLGNLVYNDMKSEGLRFRGAEKIIGAVDGYPGNGKEYDIGPETISLFAEKIRNAKTIIWAGPLGKVEEEEYTRGSREVARAIVESGAYSVAGGGDTGAFLHKYNLREQFSHVSTGGSAMLVFLAGEILPGLKALENSKE